MYLFELIKNSLITTTMFPELMYIEILRKWLTLGIMILHIANIQLYLKNRL